MAPAKLTDTDKQEIIILYRHPEETTAKIASRYGVSSTTVSRVLRQGLPDEEYETLIQQKRALAFRSQEDETPEGSEDTAERPEEEPEPKEAPKAASARPKPILKGARGGSQASVDEPSEQTGEANSLTRRRRRRSSAQEQENEDGREQSSEQSVESDKQLSLPTVASSPLEAGAAEEEDVRAIEEIWGEDLLDGDDDFDEEDLDEDDLDEDDLDEDDLDEDDLDEEDFDEDDLDEDEDEDDLEDVHLHGTIQLNILPLDEASLPKVCYLVIDRAAELITRPLKDFADLGQIPESDMHSRTLPIFDNHRVAKRFLRRSQRVIKVPDGQMLQKTSSYLQAKGISCLLIDGQIYSLT
jgi:transposase-like protein